jgi:AcrR family transcriptional regulator
VSTEPPPSSQLGPQSVSDARAAWRKRQIVDAASRLMERTDFHSMSMQELAREAGVSVGLIYQYVPNKEDILLLVFLDILEAYRREVPEAMNGIDDPVERLAAGFRAYCAVMGRRPFLTVLGYRESSSLPVAGRRRTQELETESIELLTAPIREGIEAGVFVDTDPELVAYDLVVIAQSWALKRWFLHRRYSFDDYITAQLRLVFAAILVDPERARPVLDAVLPVEDAPPREQASTDA